VATAVYVSPLPIGVVARKSPGAVWNWVSGAWETLAATGTPTAPQFRKMTPTSVSPGSLGMEQYLDLPDVVANTPGVWLDYLTLKSDGSLAGTPSDLVFVDGVSQTGAVNISIGGVAR
jgi:hypothetical protein